MSDGSSFPPPPGWQSPPAPPPGSVPPGYGPPPGHGPPAAYAPAGYAPLHQARPFYKPGTIPLRPLGLSDMFSGAIETIRRNPKATLGIAALVLTAFLAVPAVVSIAWGAVAGLGSDLATSDELDGSSPSDVGLAVALYGSIFLAMLATTVLTGMIVHVVEHAARGQKLSAGDAWRLTRGRVWRLIGLAFLPWVMLAVVVGVVVLAVLAAAVASSGAAITVGVVGGLGAGLGVVYLYIRLFLLAAPSLVIEQSGVFAAIRRSWQLSQGQFWRLFGIFLLTMLVAGIAGQVVGFPFGLLSFGALAIWPDAVAGLVAALLAQYLAQIVSGALTTPFSASVAALQYLDQRIRKEGYDIALIAQLPGMPSGPAPYAPQPPAQPGLPAPYAPPPPYGAAPPPPPPGWNR